MRGTCVLEVWCVGGGPDNRVHACLIHVSLQHKGENPPRQRERACTHAKMALLTRIIPSLSCWYVAAPHRGVGSAREILKRVGGNACTHTAHEHTHTQNDPP